MLFFHFRSDIHASSNSITLHWRAKSKQYQLFHSFYIIQHTSPFRIFQKFTPVHSLTLQGTFMNGFLSCKVFRYNYFNCLSKAILVVFLRQLPPSYSLSDLIFLGVYGSLDSRCALSFFIHTSSAIPSTQPSGLLHKTTIITPMDWTLKCKLLANLSRINDF